MKNVCLYEKICIAMTGAGLRILSGSFDLETFMLTWIYLHSQEFFLEFFLFRFV